MMGNGVGGVLPGGLPTPAIRALADLSRSKIVIGSGWRLAATKLVRVPDGFWRIRSPSRSVTVTVMWPPSGTHYPRRLDGGARDPGAGGLEDGVERGSEVRSAIADQELDVREPLVEGEGQVAGLLHGPLAGGVGGDAAKMHPAGAVLDEHQHVQVFQQHAVHVQEIDRDDPGGLGMKKLTPARTRPTRRRIDARSTQDLPHGGPRPSRRVSSVRHGSGGVPTGDSRGPGERPGARCPGLSAGGRACAACLCRTFSRPVCGAGPAASLASRGRSRSSAWPQRGSTTQSSNRAAHGPPSAV